MIDVLGKVGILLQKGSYKGWKEKIKLDNVYEAISLEAADENWGLVIENLIRIVPAERLTLLWEILIESDLRDVDSLKEKIYLYGRSLGNKDLYGRLLFSRMAFLLYSANKETV